MVGGDGVQKRRADGRAADRELCRLAGATERTREHAPDPELQARLVLADGTRRRGVKSRGGLRGFDSRRLHSCPPVSTALA